MVGTMAPAAEDIASRRGADAACRSSPQSRPACWGLLYPLLALGVVLAPTAPSGQAASNAPAAADVRAWEGTLDLPTDEEGPPDVNPPFDLFTEARFNYPYTIRDRITGRQSVRRYRALFLENEYLKATVLPEMGGHLYSCVDKATGAEMFYANRSIRKAQIGYRGAWAAFGIEFNFPVSHNWVSLSEVDSALQRHRDGSASIVVGNIDRPYGMEWRVGLRLRPGRAVLEQDVSLYNRSPVRRRFYWWNNAAVRVEDDSRICYPMRFTAAHWFREVDTWPVNASGVDLSVVGNHLFGPVSLFAHASRETFMGIYHPSSRSGVAHYSSPLDAPTKKIWSWGGDADGLDWRRALSDDHSAYVEVQAGLFRNQETYAFLEPEESMRFREDWTPVRGIGGISRATPEGVLHLDRGKATGGKVDLSVGVNLSQTVTEGRLRVRDGGRVVAEWPLSLTPAGAFLRNLRALPAAPRYTVEVLDAAGRVLLEQTEGVYDLRPDSEMHVGPQPVHVYPPAERRSEGDFLELGTEQELEGKLLVARDTYAAGLARFAGSATLQKAAGRLAVTLRRFDEAAPLLSAVLDRVSNDAEALYYRGLALAAQGNEAKARDDWEKAQAFRAFRPAARLELARSEARGGDREGALRAVRALLAESSDAVRAGGMEVTLLRSLGRTDEARTRLSHWLEVDPADTYLRHEAVRLGAADEALWRHLAGEPERVLILAGELMGLGLYRDAQDLLERRYPAEREPAEPGSALPQDHPLVAYYRGYCRERLGGDPRADFQAASRLSTAYVFPSRADTEPVLRRALELLPADATAHFLYGSLLLAGGRSEEAVREWEEARRLDRRIPVLHRNLGLTLLRARRDAKRALAIFREGMEVDGGNVALYLAADEAHSVLGDPPDERVLTLGRFPDRAGMPPALVYKLALALAEAGRSDEAESLFRDRFFPREEGGTNVRQVFLEVRLRHALALARAGRKKEAQRIVENIARPVSGLAFTRDGLEPFLETARVQGMVAEVFALCGREDEARRRWTRASEGRGGSFLGPVYALLARRHLGGQRDETEARGRLERSLAESEVFLTQGTQFAGIVVCAQGLTLRVLGREEEARARLSEVFRLPDQRLSHFLARRVLQANDPL
jgi:tetratricopeptide (TPR) repeat protein